MTLKEALLEELVQKLRISREKPFVPKTKTKPSSKDKLMQEAMDLLKLTEEEE